MSAQHTPGPWVHVRTRKVDGMGFHEAQVHVGRSDNFGNLIARAYLGGEGATDRSEEAVTANARLIAAAPDLLSAAVVAEDLIDDMTTPGNEHEDPELYAALKALRAAILKALGQGESAS